MNELIYGIRNTDGKTVSIDEIPDDTPGLSCGCICASCGVHLMACSLKDGQHQRRHFRHFYGGRSGSVGGEKGNCNPETANETALHRMAKQIIAEERKIFVPSRNISLTEAGILDLPQEIENKIPPYPHLKADVIEGQSVELEKHLEGFTPDAVVKTARGELLVEVFVRHKVDEEKKEKARAYGAAMLEIDLSAYAETPIHRNELREIIVAEDRFKDWKHFPFSENVLKKARDYYENRDELKQYRQQKAVELQKKQKEEADRKRRNSKIQQLFEPSRYAAELDRLRDDVVFQKTYARWHQYHWYHFGEHFRKHRTVPFFVDVPISGEMVFQCDRRIWQSILFNRFIYGRRKDRAKFTTEDLFDKLASRYAINVDYDLTYKLPDPLHEDEVLWLRSQVVNRYMDYLEAIGFITTEHPLGRYKETCWKTVLASGTVTPPNKEVANRLLAALQSVDLQSPDIDRLVAEKMNDYYEEKRKKEAKAREEARREAEKKARLEAEKQAQERREAEERARLEIIKQQKLARVEREKQEALAKQKAYDLGFQDVQNLDFNAPDNRYDRYQRRWALCTDCNQIKREDEMVSYQYGKGQCRECMKQAQQRRVLP